MSNTEFEDAILKAYREMSWTRFLRWLNGRDVMPTAAVSRSRETELREELLRSADRITRLMEENAVLEGRLNPQPPQATPR